MELAVETIVRLSGERARQLGRLAAARGVSEEALVAEALDLLFRQSASCTESGDDAELLRHLEAELGPLPPARPRPPIRPDEIVSIIPVPLRPDLLRRPGDED
jgi:hypothetical protein